MANKTEKTIENNEIWCEFNWLTEIHV
jgi:hypothetical protein